MKEITLELVKEAASTFYTNEEELEAFMSGFEKEAQGNLFGAAGIGDFFRSPQFKENIASGLATGGARALAGLGVGLLGAAIVKGVNATSHRLDSAQLRANFEIALNKVREGNRVVKGAKPERVTEYANTIFKFAPNVAADPNLLSSILANAVLGEGIDPQTIKVLTELESRFKETNSSQPLNGIRV